MLFAKRSTLISKKKKQSGERRHYCTLLVAYTKKERKRISSPSPHMIDAWSMPLLNASTKINFVFVYVSCVTFIYWIGLDA